MTAIAAAAAVFLGAALQSATGFGFALVCAPVLFAILGPSEAVTAGVLLGLELSLLTLATEGRRPRVLTGEAVALVAWSLPGLAVGAIALRELPDRLLSVLVALAVLLALVLRLRVNGRARAAARRGWQTAAAGAASGALSTSTSLSGPPLVFYLLARGAAPDQMRDTLAAIFVALALLSAPALVLTGTFHVPDGVWALLAAAAAGQVLGRRAFAWLGDRYERAVLIVLAITALVALGSSAV
ncbi:MAG: uncharacterized protein QOD83_4562 [Solirubrobacteraceae bacterium]|nr:uncharacterized protein [Solirubrobacteraceae bacterium]